MNTQSKKQTRKKRKKLIRVAEGYLELMTIFEDRWPVDPSLAAVLADRTIATLDKTTRLQKSNNEQTLRRHRSHVCVLKGQACRIAKRYDRAIEFFEEALASDAENFDTLLAIAWCYKRCDRLSDAISSVEAAVKLEFSSAIAHYNLACYYALDRDVEGALSHLSVAFGVEPVLVDHVELESDFDSIRSNPDFISFMLMAPKNSRVV